MRLDATLASIAHLFPSSWIHPITVSPSFLIFSTAHLVTFLPLGNISYVRLERGYREATVLWVACSINIYMLSFIFLGGVAWRLSRFKEEN